MNVPEAIVLGFVAMFVIAAIIFAIAVQPPAQAKPSTGLIGVFGAVAPYLSLA